MKKVYRFEDNEDYWDRRWVEAGRDAGAFSDLAIYPIRYAEMVMSQGGKAVELGCGLGRIVKHYASQGRAVVGVERSKVAVDRIHSENCGLDVRVGDVRKLSFEDGAFDIAMAFGVYHNLESGMEAALGEARRILKPGGLFCISMRPDNFEMHLNEIYWRWRNRKQTRGEERFHKILIGEKEFTEMLRAARLRVDRVYRARNVSILYRIRLLRSEDPNVDEGVRRAQGYRLNAFGRALDGLMRSVFPYHSANVLVFIGRAI